MTSVVLDDIIFRLQAFGGVSEFWRRLSLELDGATDLAIRHRPGRRWQRFLPVAERCDVLHSSHFRVPLRSSTACVTTVHDLTYELGMVSGRAAVPNLWQRKKAVERAQAIVAISESTRREMLEFYGDRLRPGVAVLTIPHGRTYAAPSGDSLPARFELDRPYVLHVGNRAQYKNFERGLRGFAMSVYALDGSELLCTGPPFTRAERDLARSLDVGSRVRHVGLVSSADLGVLYEHAEALLYPSVYEGFGLPPLDAMSLGCPVVAANSSSIPEVVGNAGVLVDGTDVEAIASGLNIIAQPAERRLRVASGFERAALFSWQKAGASYAEVYRQLA
jgi:glycosyltransferase involved in cell wall biosynthesis